MQESGAEVWAYRYEPDAKWQHMALSFSKKLNVSFETEVFMQHCSWGLMQIMGFKARELGFDQHLPQLLLPSQGIEWGCKALAKFHSRYNFDLGPTIAAYNAGSAVMTPSGKYMNQEYVDGVMSWIKKLT